MDCSRRGAFYYVSVGTQVQAATARPKFLAGRDQKGFAHELGHCLNISDGGEGEVGDPFSVCPPNYDSIMSYVGGTGFFAAGDGLPNPLNPASVSELVQLSSQASALAFKDRMSAGPWFQLAHHYSGIYSYVDWSRSGVYDSQVRQGVLGMAKGGAGCNAFSQGGAEIPTATLPPQDRYLSIARGGGYAFIAVIEHHPSDRRLAYFRAQLGAGLNDDCGTFQRVGLMGGSVSPSFAGPSIYFWNNQLFVATMNTTNLRLLRYSVAANGSLSYLGALIVGSVPLEMVEFVVLYDGTSTPSLAAVWSEAGTPDRYLMMKWNSASQTWSSPVQQTVCGGGVLSGSGSPALVAWPDPYNTTEAYGYRRTCGLFPDSNLAGRFYCYEPSTGCWSDRTQNVFPASPHDTAAIRTVEVTYDGTQYRVPDASVPLDLVFVPERLPNGTPVSMGKGNLHLIGSGPGAVSCHGRDASAVWISNRVSSYYTINTGELWSSIRSRDWIDHFQNKWACLDTNPDQPTQPRANLSVYVDETMGRALGATRLYLKGREQLTFYPDADGSPNMLYKPQSDFVVMKDWLCTSVKQYMDAAGKALCSAN